MCPCQFLLPCLSSPSLDPYPYTAVIQVSVYGYGPYKYGRILKHKNLLRIRYGAVPYRTVFRKYGMAAEPYNTIVPVQTAGIFMMLLCLNHVILI